MRTWYLPGDSSCPFRTYKWPELIRDKDTLLRHLRRGFLRHEGVLSSVCHRDVHRICYHGYCHKSLKYPFPEDP